MESLKTWRADIINNILIVMEGRQLVQFQIYHTIAVLFGSN